MSSQLHEAVRLAQEGQREEARRVLLQVLESASEKDNEVAWLWLASVAANQDEYVRALNEVLRINPANEQAQNLKTEFEEQYVPPPAPEPAPQTAPAPPTGFPAPEQPPAPRPPEGVPPAPPAYYGPPQPPPPGYPPPGYPPGYLHAPPYARPTPRRGGCLRGLLLGCFFSILIYIVLPAAAFGLWSYSDYSMGPLDTLAVYLPGEFGRKTVAFEIDDYDVSVTVPRSWYLAEQDNRYWKFWRTLFDNYLQFDDANSIYETGHKWVDDEVDLDDMNIDELDVGNPIYIHETNPLTLATGASITSLILAEIISARDADMDDFTCDEARDFIERWEDEVASNSSDDMEAHLLESGGERCGVRLDIVEDNDDAVFRHFSPPNSLHSVVFLIPMSDDEAAIWTITVPEEHYDTFEEDIETIVETAKVEQ